MNGFVSMLSATAFMDTASEAISTLSLLERGPFVNECLKKELNHRTPLDALLDLGGMLWPEHHRYLVDTLWSNSPPAQPLAIVRDNFLQAPSPKSIAACVFPTGPDDTAAAIPDAAFSMTARTLLLCYAIWEGPQDDPTNSAWHRKTIAELEPFAVGHYVGESDIVANSTRAERSFAPANWQRLQSLRRKYDPDGLFHGHFSAG